MLKVQTITSVDNDTEVLLRVLGLLLAFGHLMHGMLPRQLTKSHFESPMEENQCRITIKLNLRSASNVLLE